MTFLDLGGLNDDKRDLQGYNWDIVMYNEYIMGHGL